MMPDAVVKGEAHLSRKDKQAVMEMDFSSFDAVFCEGSDKNCFHRDIDMLYALYAVGQIVYGATFGRIYYSKDDIEEKAAKQGIPFRDEIDVPIYETYDMVPKWNRLLSLVLSPFWAFIMLGIISLPVTLPINLLALQPGQLFQIIGGIVLVFLYGFVWAFAYFQLVESQVMYERDERMVGEILQETRKEGYESVLIICGGNHRSGIAASLREEGWNVDERTTESLIGKLLLWYNKFAEAINPRALIQAVISKLKS